MNSILLHDASVQRFSIHCVWGAYGEEERWCYSGRWIVGFSARNHVLCLAGSGWSQHLDPMPACRVTRIGKPQRSEQPASRTQPIMAC